MITEKERRLPMKSISFSWIPEWGKKQEVYWSEGPSKDCVFLKFQWSPSWMLRKKSLVESDWHAVGTGHGAMLQTSASPGANLFLSFPSNEAQAWLLLLKGTCTLSVTCSGNIRGRKDNEWGQIGVKRMPGTCGWTIDPPAAKEYAVLPDVVDKIKPSPWTQVTKELSQ